MAGVPDEGTERGRRHGRPERRKPAERGPSTGLDRVATRAAIGLAGRRRRPLARAHDLRREADGAAALRAAARVPDRAAVQPRSRAPRGADWRPCSGPAPPISGSATARRCSSTSRRRATSRCACATRHGRPTTASFVIQDKVGRVYPARSKRLAPDFFFQNQIYRADGETVRLPDGDFTVTCGRGPEYVPETRARHDRRARARRSTSRCGAGSIPPARAGIPATITSTRPGAATTRVPPKACGRKT